ncbi:MAG: DUF294 nucleotidyltransferase-like domain-containing protein, partial [Christiangramia sp.]|nr:DUF294 nucleotidyltransferase-like domain-containing protein [Christiangramia sp.]
MKNTIASRVADFLKAYPPFNFIPDEQLLKIAGKIKVIYLEKGENIFRKGEKGHNLFYVVHKGAIALFLEEKSFSETVDECDEGDIVGLRPLFARENYQLTASAEEETILYGIPIASFKTLSESNSSVANFLMLSFASNTRNPYSIVQKESLLPNLEVEVKSSPLFELQPAPIRKRFVAINPEISIRKAADIMKRKKVGSVLISENDLPVGIVTDEDFRNVIATGKLDVDASISSIMSSPVICYPSGLTIAQAQLTMMKHRINHICITEDGTPNTKIIGILSEHDIRVSEGDNPTVLMKAIKRSGSTKELKKIRNKIVLLLKGYIDQNIPLTHISRIIFELNDATIKRVVERCIDKLEGPPPVDFAWLSLGSQGRKEQLLITDQDNAIVFEDVPEERLEETRAYFLRLAKKVNKRLNIIGYEFCPADVMAKNPEWCLSLTEWKQKFTNWIVEPGADEILLCSIFFDFDITYGDVKLTNSLADHIFSLTENNKKFLRILGSSAIRNPSPLGFFRNFLVEQDGEKKDFFDLKKRGILPITDAGRLLAVEHKIKNINNTAERFEKIAEMESYNRELFLSCSYTAK